MGWDNPPVPWREFERRLSWGTGSSRGTAGRDAGAAADQAATEGEDAGRDEPRRPVTRLPVLSAGALSAGALSAGALSAAALSAEAPPWAELHCHSSYSFLDGASSPADLVCEAAARGLSALAITDHDGMYGVPQFAQAAARLRDSGIALGTVFGAELSLDLARKAPGGTARRRGAVPQTASGRVAGTVRAGVPDPAGRHLLVLARDPEGYRRLCQIISTAQLAGGEKGLPLYDEAALAGAHDGHWVILTGCRKGAVPAALAAG